MIALDDDALMLARGRYSTIRSEHEASKEHLQKLTGQVAALASQILKRAQPADNSQPIDVSEQVGACRQALDEIEQCVARCAELAKQRAELKPAAWGGRK